MELVGPVGLLLLLNQFRRLFQEHIVIDPHPGLGRILSAEIRGSHHLVEPAGGSKLVEVPVGHIAAVPVGGMVSQFFS